MFAFTLLFTLLGFGINSAKASDSGCFFGDLFSRTTGQSCGANLATDCRAGDLFSSVTGNPCSGTNVSSDNSSDVAQFNNLFKSNFKIGLRGNSDVKALQQFLKDQGYYFGKLDGSYGRITARAVNDFKGDNDLSVTTPSTTVIPTPLPPIQQPTPVSQPPTMSVLSANVSSLNFSSQVGVNPSAQIITVYGCPTHGCLIGGHYSDSLPNGIISWITVVSSNDNTGTASENYTVSVNVSDASTANGHASLPAGTYNGSVVFSVFGTSGQKLTIPVTLTITGSIASTVTNPQPSASSVVSIIYPTNNTSFTTTGPATVTWTDTLNNSNTQYVLWVNGPQAVFTNITRTQAGCSASDKCSYSLSIITPGTYYMSITNQTNGASGAVHFTIAPTLTPTYPSGCSSASGYSSVTGDACDGSTTITPVVTVTANPSTIFLGQSSTVSWSSTGNNLSCKLSDGLVSASGNQVVYPTSTTNYSVTCANPTSATGTGSATVNVITPTYRSGCSSISGYSSVDGVSCAFPLGCSSAQGYSTVDGSSCSAN